MTQGPVGSGAEGGRAPAGSFRISPALAGAAVVGASYVFLLALAAEDRRGRTTLSSFRALVALLRGVGRVATGLADRLLAPPILLPLLGVAAIVLLRRSRRRTGRYDVALSLGVPLLGAAASLLKRGDLGLAALAGLLAGVCLAAGGRGGEEPGRGANPWLFLVPLGLGAVLRFHALAEIPKGYAEHAVAAHATLSLPYREALSSSLHALKPEPFLTFASHALFHEQSGLSSLIAAFGFELFGVTLTVTRLISAALGTLTVLVAYGLGRALGGVRLGLVFSFLLAVSPWHVAVSRYGAQEHILSPLQFLLSLFFVVLAVNTGRVRHALLAGFSTALAWFIYAVNLVVPLIVGLFLLCRATLDWRPALRNWWKALLGIGCFTLVSFVPVRFLISRGLLTPNIRTGYMATKPILTNLAERSRMITLETNQLLRHAVDPWFSMEGGGLGVLQGALLMPGIVLAVAALRRRQNRHLALLVLIGLPIAALPAVFAPDPSFRRLMLVATLAALVSAFTLLRLAAIGRAAGMTGRALTAVACGGAFLLAAAGTFGYFDRAYLGEDTGSLHFRSLGETVSRLLGKEPLVVVVPVRDNVNDIHRYIKLMAYDTLRDAERRGVAREALYLVTTCEDPVDGRRPQAANASQTVVVLHLAVPEPRAPCGPEFVSRLKAYYPADRIVIAVPRAPN